MIPGSVAKRYAKALVEVAAASGEQEAVARDLRAFADVLRDQHTLRQVLANPSVPRRDAAAIVREIGTAMRLLPLTVTFLQIALEGGRLSGLDAILEAYELLLDERLGRLKAVVTSAVPLDGETRERLRRRLATVTGKEVYLEVQTDPGLLGGLVARIGSRLYDGSLKTQLARLRDELARA